jgi:S1-C subfamily serine protease
MLSRILAGPAAAVLLLVLPALAPAPARADDDVGAKVYAEALKSVVWIHSPRGEGKSASGTGSLVDRKLKLVLTNYHVVGDTNRAVVMFPAYKGDKVVAEREYYLKRLKTDGIQAKVVARDKKADLALIQLESVPDGAVALPLAKESVVPGQTVHSLGNPGGSGALWVYTPGRVRQVYDKKWKAQLSEDQVVTFEAHVIETDSATNPGDSGGPLLNDKGQLVGVTQGGAIKERLISTFIDVVEVKQFLLSREVKAVGKLDVPRRVAEVFTVKDGGKFFSDDAVKKSNEGIKEIEKKYERDLLIETFATVPGGEAEAAKVKAMSRDDRAAYFRKWARERLKEEQVNGVYILACKEPSHLVVEVPARAQAVLGDNAGKELADLLLARFREKKYDDGLAEAVKLVSEKLAKSKEK